MNFGFDVGNILTSPMVSLRVMTFYHNRSIRERMLVTGLCSKYSE